MSVKFREVVVTKKIKDIFCDTCGDTMNDIRMGCSHCGADICLKHFPLSLRSLHSKELATTEYEHTGNRPEDGWVLCPKCAKIAKIVEGDEEYDECEGEGKRMYPVFKDTGKEMSLEFQ
jgi:hypothetical protein